MENFKIEEFNCRCCGANKMNPDFLNKLQEAKTMANTKFIISSGYRCEKHNAEIGSTSNNHTTGVAADIVCSRGSQRHEIMRALIKAGFKRFGLGEQYIHVDSNDRPNCIWIY
ncbi:MAG: D-Ala-D-Ala carboxypeptidase family metallohydrolase [Candidatus Omnitrophica bacterium]|jgi:uncharacterized protein YcbK (DUF882 family)|nr:D-Ala-D-Ala carboxypeptidase family metallohydrolase [Candidatus Omnitrophota bacterium]